MSDFGHGLLYVIGVGVIGGMMLHASPPAARGWFRSMNYSRRLDLPERARVLVITLRRLGDVLLTTPLIRTIRRALPQARLEALVFRGTEGILAGNPDLDGVMTMSERPSGGETLGLIRALWRRYDLVVATQSGDRPTFFALVTGRQRVALVPRAGETGAWWKRHAHQVAIASAPDVHRVTQLLALAAAIGFEPVRRWSVRPAAIPRARPGRRTRCCIQARSTPTSDGTTRLAPACSGAHRARAGGRGDRRSR